MPSKDVELFGRAVKRYNLNAAIETFPWDLRLGPSYNVCNHCKRG